MKSSKLFRGQEHCDCWRGNATAKSPSELTLENRFYHQPSNNISISYLTYLGQNVPQHGHLSAIRSRRYAVLDENEYESNSGLRNPYDWLPVNVSTAVEDIVASDPQDGTGQRVVVLWNSGFWGKFKTEKDAKFLKESLLSMKKSVGTSGRIFYKTTTTCLLSSMNRVNPHEYDQIARKVVPSLEEHGISLYDTNKITAPFKQIDVEDPIFNKIYWDAVHFQPYVYEELNNVLLHKLEGMSS
jgi:hypothetical protein